jgi:hypothetical protein
MDHAGILSPLHVTHIHRGSQGCKAHIFAGPVKKIRQNCLGKNLKNPPTKPLTGTKKTANHVFCRFFSVNPPITALIRTCRQKSKIKQPTRTQSAEDWRFYVSRLFPYVLHCTEQIHAHFHNVSILVHSLKFRRRRVRIANWAQDNLWVKKVLAPSNKPLKITDYVFCPYKKITSRTIRITGTLIRTVDKVRKSAYAYVYGIMIVSKYLYLGLIFIVYRR